MLTLDSILLKRMKYTNVGFLEAIQWYQRLVKCPVIVLGSNYLLIPSVLKYGHSHHILKIQQVEGGMRFCPQRTYSLLRL